MLNKSKTGCQKRKPPLFRLPPTPLLSASLYSASPSERLRNVAALRGFGL